MDANLDVKISQNLKFEIETSGKKKSEIARTIGISVQAIHNYCSGRVQPSLATLSRICSYIDVSADDILEIKKV